MSPSSPQRIILASESRLLREALKKVIGKSPGLQVIGEVSHENEVSSVFEQSQADWLVVSIPPGGKIPLIAEKLIITRYPTIRILGLSDDGGLIIVKWLAFQERRLSGLSLDEMTGLMQRRPGAFGEDEG